MKTAVNTMPQAGMSAVWMRAAVVGSIWASLEIIIGSFLHNLRVPFSGTVLAVMSVYLLVAFVQIWDNRGLVWRAGLICALMKSVSPSAVILGPMTGIMLEALILESFIRIFGRNLPGYLAGGAAAVLSALVHKIFTLLILYGFDLVRIVSDLYQFSVRQINLPEISPAALIAFIAGLYMVAGMAGATGGYLAGRSYLRKQPFLHEKKQFDLQKGNMLFSNTSRQRLSVAALLINLLLMVTCLLLVNRTSVVPSLLCGAGYVTFTILYYRGSLNRLKKPGIWIQFFILTMASAFIWNTVAGKGFFDSTGLVAGFKMIWRAIIIIIGFAAISVELKNPMIKSILYTRGLANLYQSLTLAFTALPAVIAGLPSSKEILKNHRKSSGYLFSIAVSLLPLLEEQHLRRPEIFILTGDRLQGKTTFAVRLADYLKSAGMKVNGFISEAVHNKDERVGFKLTSLASGEAIDLCSTTDRFGGAVRQGRFWFNQAALLRGEEVIGSAGEEEKDIVIIDEVGPMEINGNGWYNAIEDLCSRSSRLQVWTVRRSLARKAARRWNVGNVHIIDIALTTPEEVSGMIIR